MTFSSTWCQDTCIPPVFGLNVLGPQECACLVNSNVCAWLPVSEALSTSVEPQTLEALALLHSMPQTLPSERFGTAEIQQNARKLYTLELMLNRPLRADIDHRYPHSSLVYYAARVYVSCALRNLPRRSTLVSTFLRKLEASLYRLTTPFGLATLADGQLTAVLWALILSRFPLASDACHECGPFSAQVTWAATKLGITTYQQLLLALRKIAWIQGFLERDLQSLSR